MDGHPLRQRSRLALLGTVREEEEDKVEDDGGEGTARKDRGKDGYWKALAAEGG